MNAYSYRLPTGELSLDVKKADYPVEKLLGIAARQNVRRGFLFLSRVLGKHVPVSPKMMAETHIKLAEKIPTLPDGAIVFIAMAETAIGLGQGIFEAYLKEHPERSCLFLHSTRYLLKAHPALEFEESHSHAPAQFLHFPIDPPAQHLFLEAHNLVLIDDEASTGKTFQHLIQAYRKQNQNLAHVHISLLTNFMSEEAENALFKQCGLPCSIGALLTGTYHFEQKYHFDLPQRKAQALKLYEKEQLPSVFGRLGKMEAVQLDGNQLYPLTKMIAPNERVLILGTGEFMHPAFLLGQFLEARDISVAIQSTTRSPILQWGAVKESIQFWDNYNEGVLNFLYNGAREQYHHCLICHETPPSAALFDLAKQLNGRLFYFQKDTHIEEIFVP